MQSILEHHIKRNKFSHGYLFYGNKERALELIEKAARFIFCENASDCGNCALCELSIVQNPNFFSYSFDKFGINDSHEIAELAHRKSAGGGVKIFKIEFNQISREAENAALKLFEEPPKGTHFLIYTPSLENIIDTLKSRLVAIYCESDGLPENESLNNFLKMDFSARLDFFSKIKDKQEAKNLILGFMKDSKNNPRNLLKLEKGIRLLDRNIPLSLIGPYIFS